MPVCTSRAPPSIPSSTSLTFRPDMKLIVHLIRSASTPNASSLAASSFLLVLLHADWTSINSVPATLFLPQACSVRFMRTATGLRADDTFLPERPSSPSDVRCITGNGFGRKTHGSGRRWPVRASGSATGKHGEPPPRTEPLPPLAARPIFRAGEVSYVVTEELVRSLPEVEIKAPLYSCKFRTRRFLSRYDR